MQNQRAPSGSSPEPISVLDFTASSTTSSPVSDQQIILNHNIHDLNVSDPQDYSNSMYFGSVYQEEPELNAFSQGEDDSFGLNPLLMESSQSNNAAQNQHPNSDYTRRLGDPSQAVGSSGPYESTGIREGGSSSTQSSGLPGSPSVEVGRSSCKRKSGDGSICGPSSSNSGIQIVDSSSRNPAAPAHRNPGSSLNVPGSHDIPEPVSESYQINIPASIIPSIQQEALTPEESSTGRNVGRPIPIESQIYDVPGNLQPVQLNPGSDSLGSSRTERNAAASTEGNTVRRINIRPINVPDNVTTGNVNAGVQPPQNNDRRSEDIRRIYNELVRRVAAVRSNIRDLQRPIVVSSSNPSPTQAEAPITSIADLRRALRNISSDERARIRTEMREILDTIRTRRDTLVEDASRSVQIARSAVANLYDHYRDMRVDVDNMSYEELLALEARIGDVETGLSEQTISSGLKRQKLIRKEGQDAEFCCVCQAEYEEGEELGTLECGHDFHSDCITPWLRKKNLCPICKSTALNTTRNPTR